MLAVMVPRYRRESAGLWRSQPTASIMTDVTFSILALSPDGGSLGVATATHSFCVGRSVPALAPGVGGVVTQGWTNRAFRHVALAGLRRGATVSEVLQDLAAMDLAFPSRQVALLSSGGVGVAHTGADTEPWAGAIVEPGLVVAGNTLGARSCLRRSGTASVRAPTTTSISPRCSSTACSQGMPPAATGGDVRAPPS